MQLWYSGISNKHLLFNTQHNSYLAGEEDSVEMRARTHSLCDEENIDKECGPDVARASGSNVIERAFLNGRPQWMDEPVISRWATPSPKLLRTLEEVNELLHQWTKNVTGPFYPFSDALWLQTAELLRDAGLPWHNNNLNHPDEIDPSWPFHFKEFEKQAVLSKGARVGDENASGYICPWSEANHYAIRALQQELRRQRPSQKPLLVAARIESAMIQSAAQQFGLDLFQIGDDWAAAEITLVRRTRGCRPIIFAATLADDTGRVDDFDAIGRLSELLPLVLHVDATRTFDYITTLSESAREGLGIPKLLLCHPYLDGSDTRAIQDNTIRAATIVAAGMNCSYPPPVAVLTPHSLGSPSSRQVEYVRGTDSTLAGSRDALAPLLMYLQEVRFGPNGIREIYEECELNRRKLCRMLVECEIPFEMPPASLDVIVRPSSLPKLSLRREFGIVSLNDGAMLITVQPSATSRHLESLVELFSANSTKKKHRLPKYPANPSKFPLPFAQLAPLIHRVKGWRILARSSSGYPLNQAPYSALGPIIGRFLPVTIDSEWVVSHGREILKQRKNSFGLSPAEHGHFAAIFTTGSTMGNRVGLHTALAQHPGAFVYFSKATHYSIKKTVLDNDELTGRWSQDKRPKYAEIATDDLGAMIPEALVQQVVRDKALSDKNNESHQIILLANVGTTFTAGRDDIIALRQCLRAIGSEVSYIHVDGALDFGFRSNMVALGPPDIMTKGGVPTVQGITLSHHKAFGIMISGEVICYSPESKRLTGFDSPIDPRIVLETWLFQQMYLPEDLVQTRKYCVNNANRLRTKLAGIGVATRFNEDSFITLIERLPPWMVQDYHLAPEGDWVHYITMPHITGAAVDRFVETVSKLDGHFAAVFRSIKPDLDSACGQPLALQRVRCQDETLFPKLVQFVKERYDNSDDLDGFCLETFKRRYAYGAMSFAAFDAHGNTCIAFLVETSVQRELSPGPVLVAPKFSSSNGTVKKLASKALSLLSQLFFESVSAALEVRTTIVQLDVTNHQC